MKINKFLIFILLAFCFTSFINFDIYANDNTINLQDKCNLLTNKDDVDISSIDDLDIEYNIQDYADSYIYLLEDDKYLRYSNKSNSGTSIDYFKYGGNIYEQGAGLIANASDAITKIIPEEYFKMVGEYSYFGLDYGFYIKTFIKDDIVEDYNKFNTKTLRFAYVSDIFIIDYTYLKPSYSSILQTTFKLNPLFSARYYTIETENMADHKIYLKENQNYTSLEELNVLVEEGYSEDFIIIPNVYPETPNFNMNNLAISSIVENKYTLNDKDSGYNCYNDNGLFLTKVSMEYDTYSIIIDSNEYSTDGYKLENINLSKDKDNIIVDIFVFAIGELNTAASYILFINDVGSQIFIDNTCDIEIKHNPISENYVFFNQHKLQCDYYNRLIKNIFINVGDIHSNLNTINTYNSNDIVVDFFYAEEQSEIIVPTKNYINFSFSITDENNISTGGKINGDSEDFENLIVASIEYDLFDEGTLNENNYLTNSLNSDVYNFIVDVNYTAIYTLKGINTLNEFQLISSLPLIDYSDNILETASIYKVNETSIEKTNIQTINDSFLLEENTKYLILVKCNTSNILNVSLSIKSFKNTSIISNDSIEFNFLPDNNSNHLFKLNNNNLSINISRKLFSSTTINSEIELSNSNSTNYLFTLKKNIIYKITIINQYLNYLSNISLNIVNDVIHSKEQEVIQTYINENNTCTLIYTAQTNERLTISTSSILDTEFNEIIINDGKTYVYDGDYIDEENDVYDPNASLTINLNKGESIILTINEYFGTPGTLYIYVTVLTL